MKMIIVVGARPNFMKVAPIMNAVNLHNLGVLGLSRGRGEEPFVEVVQPVLVHTGQHYSELMSDAFFRDLRLPKPDLLLGVGSFSHAVQTAEIMKRFEEVLLCERPDAVVVVGDVNSTFACAMVTAKISFDGSHQRPLLAHVEAGLRSYDRAMPEEINRFLTDHLCDLLFVTEEAGIENLRREGISEDKIHFVGNTMIDSLLAFHERADHSRILEQLELRTPAAQNGANGLVRRFGLLTLHRPSNVDNREAFLRVLAGIEELAAECPVIFPVHPRTQGRIHAFGLNAYFGNGSNQRKGMHAGAKAGGGFRLTSPLGYLDFLCLMKHAAIVVTDSGGVQEETTSLGIPCVTVREITERPVTVENGTNVVAGTSSEGIRNAIRSQLERKAHKGAPKNWDGLASRRILDVLVRAHCERTSSRRSLQPCA
jgi:UDP-N-acetylglucosamine 2-epimerase (non-hydrolysing)